VNKCITPPTARRAEQGLAVKEPVVSDVVFLVLTLAGFGLLGLIVKGAERL
jgi:hypothetical protein